MDAVIWNIAGIFFAAFGILLFILLPFTPEEGARDILRFAVFFSLLGVFVLVLSITNSRKEQKINHQASDKED